MEISKESVPERMKSYQEEVSGTRKFHFPKFWHPPPHQRSLFHISVRRHKWLSVIPLSTSKYMLVSGLTKYHNFLALLLTSLTHRVLQPSNTVPCDS